MISWYNGIINKKGSDYMVELKRGEYIYYTTKRGCSVKIGNDCGYLYYEKEVRTKKNGYTSISYKLVTPTKEMLNVAKAC